MSAKSAADLLRELKEYRKAKTLNTWARLGGSPEPAPPLPSFVFEVLRTETPSEKQLDWLEQKLEERAMAEAMPPSSPAFNISVNAAPSVPRSASRPASKRKRSKLEIKRERVIFGAIQAQLKGPKYCAALDSGQLPIPLAWQGDGCPDTYAAAYKHGLPWQKKIQDEKHRYQRRYDSLSAAERESIIQGAPLAQLAPSE
jgi:hypothetical protein